MRTSVMGPALCVAALFLLTPLGVSGQSSNQSAPTFSGSEQALRDIFNEVHLLRVEMVRASANTYRSQVLLNRIKVEQDQVARLRRDLNDIQDKLAEIRVEQTRKRSRLAEMAKKRDMGLVSDGEINAMAQEVEDLEQREQTILTRVSQFGVELDSSRNKLVELNTRLDGIEREMITPATDDPVKPAKKP